MRIGPHRFIAASLVAAAVVLQGCDGSGKTGKPPSAASSMGPLEEATNRQGRDISQGGTRMANAQQCSDLCGARPDCKAMSFAKDTGVEGGICFLKSDVPAATENAAITSAVKIASSPVAAP